MDNWSKLNKFQLGKYGEYFTKMEFTKYGFDVYGTEVDDKGIDFVIRRDPSTYFDIQVKSIRKNKGNWSYVFFRKDKFKLRKNLIISLVLFENDKSPSIFLIPSLNWRKKSSLLVDRDYGKGKSKPEFGISITKSNFEELTSLYPFENMVTNF